MAATSGRLEVVEPLLDAVKCAPPGWADEPFEPTAGVAASFLINVPALTTLLRGYLAQFRGDAEATAAFAAQALAESKPEERLLSATAHGFLAVAEWLRGRARRGRTRLRVQRHRVARGRPSHDDRVALVRAGAGPARPGPPGRGRADLSAGPGQPGHVRSAAAGGGTELRGPGRDRLSAGRARPSPCGTRTEGIALCRQFVHTTPLANGLATLAMIRQATGDPAGALEAITEAGQASPGPAGMLNPVPAQRARLLLAQGNLPGAARFPQENGLGPDDEADYARESGHLVLARLLLAQDRPGQALALLDRLHAAAVAQDRTGSLIEIGALRALALAASGEETAAVHRPGRGAAAGLSAGLRAGLRRRGPADGRAARPADRGPARRPGSRRRPAGLPGPAPAGLRHRAARV